MTFSDLKLAEPILRAIAVENYSSPSPIQRQAIPHLLAGRDLLGCAQTGTGKTAAFALPIAHSLYEKRNSDKRRMPKVLVLAPTRELAAQVAASFAAYGRFTGLKTLAIFGGVNQNPQVTALKRGVDVLVATPGRLKDLINQKLCDLRCVHTLVLDEADHMLDMGFIHDVRTIIAKVPQKRQTLLFSATMPAEIASLAASVLNDPVNVAVAPVSSAVETVAQSVYHVDKSAKSSLLVTILRDPKIETCLVFSRTKHGADKICKMLNAAGIKAAAIHGNKSQSARNDALAGFKKGRLRVLVATDIAARGIDVNGISLVVNYHLPDVPETYVHRIGRTGRAGRKGMACTFCDAEERSSLRAIERLIAVRLPLAPNSAPAPRDAESASAASQTRPAPSSSRLPAPSGARQNRRTGKDHGKRVGVARGRTTEKRSGEGATKGTAHNPASLAVAAKPRRPRRRSA